MVAMPGRSGGHNRKRTEERLGNANFAEDDPRHHNYGVHKPVAQKEAVRPALVFPDGSRPEQMVVDLWEAMEVSGFNEHYTQADWQGALILLYNLDQMIKEMIGKGSISAMKMAEMRAVLSDLLVTESSRRRLKLEVQRPSKKAEQVAETTHLELLRELS